MEELLRAARMRGHENLQGANVHSSLDTGSGFLKCSLALLYPEDLEQPTKAKHNRRSYSAIKDKGLDNFFKNSGVKRLLIVGIAPLSEESYPIVQEFLKSLDDPTVPTDSIFLSDLKILYCGVRSPVALFKLPPVYFV